MFNVNTADAAKLFKKKFACGSAVVKGDCGQPDTVDIQGDAEDDLLELLVKEYKIPANKISFVDGGTKKGGKKG